MAANTALAAEPSSRRSTLATGSRTARSAISNGTTLLPGVDGRSAEARRFRDVLSEIVSDLGGADRLSEGQRQIARRCALLSVECEKVEAVSVSGGPIDLDAYGQLTDRLGRAFQRLGLKRVARDVTPDFRSYVAQKGKAA